MKKLNLHFVTDLDDAYIHMIDNSLKHLESLTLDISNGYLMLINRLSLVCKNLEQLKLTGRDEDYSAEMVQAIGQFHRVENLELSTYVNSIELDKCPSLEKITFVFRYNEELTYFVNMMTFFHEFGKSMQHANGKIEFKREQQIIGFLTKQEFIWRNKLMHWIGYEPSWNSTNLNLLDLTEPLDASKAAQTTRFHSRLLGCGLSRLTVESKQTKQAIR